METFPLTRSARKEHLNKLKNENNAVSTQKVPGKGTMNVYSIPLDYLSYNPHNTRFLAQTGTLERLYGRTLCDENPEHVKQIEKFIWEEKRSQNDNTINSLLKHGQIYPGVVTADGVILSGNRRFRLIREIQNNPDKYQSSRTDISSLNRFEAVILSEENLSRKDIIQYESFYQFGIEDKVEYNPIQKYIAAYEQKELGFTNMQIANNFMAITEGKENVVKKWLEVYEYMDEYLDYIGEKDIFTGLEGREEAFLNLHTTIKGFKTGKAGKQIWAFKDSDLDELKLVFFDYIRINIPTHDFRIFKTLFSNKERWDLFANKINELSSEKTSTLADFEEYRDKNAHMDINQISTLRQNDFAALIEKDLKYLYGVEAGRQKSEEAHELPIDTLKSIQQRLTKLEAFVNDTKNNNILKSDEFLDAIRDIQKRVGRIKQKVD